MCYSRALARFHSPDLRDPQQLQGLALPKASSRMSQAWEISLREQSVDVRLLSISCSFFHRIVSRLAMCHSSVFNQQVDTFDLAKMCSQVYYAWKIFLREKCVDVRLLSISCSFLPLYHFAFSYILQSHFQSTGAYFRPL